jgi:hypothetical protein
VIDKFGAIVMYASAGVFLALLVGLTGMILWACFAPAPRILTVEDFNKRKQKQ